MLLVQIQIIHNKQQLILINFNHQLKLQLLQDTQFQISIYSSTHIRTILALILPMHKFSQTHQMYH